MQAEQLPDLCTVGKAGEGSKKMTREEILETAKECVCSDRENQYGSPEDSFDIIAKFWNAYLTQKIRNYYVSTRYNGNLAEIGIRPDDVAAMMGLLKIARIANGLNKNDNWIDLAGYAACGGEGQSNRFDDRDGGIDGACNG